MSANKRPTDGKITLSTVVMASIAIGCFALAVSSPQLAAIGGPYGMPPPVIPLTPPQQSIQSESAGICADGCNGA